MGSRARKWVRGKDVRKRGEAMEARMREGGGVKAGGSWGEAMMEGEGAGYYPASIYSSQGWLDT